MARACGGRQGQRASERNRIRYKENLKWEKNKRRGNIYGSRISREPHPVAAAYARSEFIYHHQHLTTGDISCSALVPTATLSSPPFPSPSPLDSPPTLRGLCNSGGGDDNELSFSRRPPLKRSRKLLFLKELYAQCATVLYIYTYIYERERERKWEREKEREIIYIGLLYTCWTIGFFLPLSRLCVPHVGFGFFDIKHSSLRSILSVGFLPLFYITQVKLILCTGRITNISRVIEKYNIIFLSLYFGLNIYVIISTLVFDLIIKVISSINNNSLFFLLLKNGKSEISNTQEMYAASK